MAIPVIIGGIVRAGAALGRVGATALKIGGAGSKAAAIKLTANATKAVKKFEKIGEVPDDVIEKGYEVFYKETPIDKGNARRKTKLNKQKTEIQANYPYAERLDDGYSKQSPQGMSKPAKKAMKQHAKQVAFKIDKG